MINLTIKIQRMQQTWHAILLPQKPRHVCCTADFGRWPLGDKFDSIRTYEFNSQ